MSSDNEPGPSRRNGHRQEDSDMEEEEEQQQRDVKQQPDPYINFTVERFENIPVKQDSDLRDVRMAKSKMQSALEKLDPWVTMARDSAASLEQASPDDPMVNDLWESALKAIEMKQIVLFQIEAIDTVLVSLRREHEEAPDLVESYRAVVEDLTNKYMSQTRRAKFKDNTALLDFRQTVWEVNHPDEGCPPLTRWLPREAGDAPDDEEIEFSGSLQTFKCPLTMMYFTDAAKSTSCKHHYEYSAIMDHIRAGRIGRRGAACPIGGCKELLSAEMIVRDPDMQRRATRNKKLQKERAVDQADDEGYIAIE